MFKTPHHPDWQNDWGHRLVDVALATSAAPMYFPIHSFNNQCYLDGGLVANSPAFLGMLEAKSFLRDGDTSRIHVMSIGTMNASATMDTASSLDRGILRWRRKIFDVTIGAQEKLLDDMLRFELGARLHRINETAGNDSAKNIGLDVVTPAATETLIGTGKVTAQRELSPAVIQQLQQHQPDQATFFHGPNKNTFAQETNHVA